jgi:hypothetical protein
MADSWLRTGFQPIIPPESCIDDGLQTMVDHTRMKRRFQIQFDTQTAIVDCWLSVLARALKH